MRIMLMGLPGSNTRELAQKYSQQYGIPFLCLDDLCRSKDGRPRPANQVCAVIKAWLKGADWILEGGYPALLLNERIKAADAVILLSPSAAALWKRQGLKTWYQQRKDRARMRTLFRALAARQDSRIHLAKTPPDQLPGE